MKAPADQGAAAISRAIETLDKFLDIAEAQLSRVGFLAGDTFTLADIQFGHVLYRYFNIPTARQNRATSRRYYDALTARPAFAEHVMVSYEELRTRR